MRKGTIVSISVFVMMLAFSVAGMAQAGVSIQAPEGWKQCPRCQNNKDRTEMNAKYQVAGHAFNPHDLSGVWGFSGVAGTFRNAPPLTDWGKKQQAATLSSKNAAGESLHDKDTYKGSGAAVNCDPPGWPRLHLDNYGFEFIMLPTACSSSLKSPTRGARSGPTEENFPRSRRSRTGWDGMSATGKETRLSSRATVLMKDRGSVNPRTMGPGRIATR